MDADTAANPICTIDADCPGAKLCYVNMSWSEEEAFCGCSNFWGKTGDDCLGLGPHAIILASVISILLLISVATALAALRDIFSTMRVFGRGLKASAAFTTLVQVTFALGFFSAWMVSYMHELLAPWEGDAVAFQADGTKVSVYKTTTSVVIIGTQIFAYLALLNVSVMWIEMSQRARKLTPTMVNNVSKYRTACIAIGAVFAFLMTGLGASGKRHYTAPLALPFLLALAIFFVVGRIRMVGLLNEAISRGGESFEDTKSGSGSKPTSAAHRTQATIKRCSRRVIVGMFGTVLSGMLHFFMVKIPAGGWRAFSPTGGFSPPALVAMLIPTSVLYAMVSIFLYAHQPTRRLIRRKLGITTSDSNGSSVARPSEVTSSCSYPTPADVL